MDIQNVLNEVKDARNDLARLKGRVGSMDTMLLGVTILLGVNCIATIIVALAVWNTNGG